MIQGLVNARHEAVVGLRVRATSNQRLESLKLRNGAFVAFHVGRVSRPDVRKPGKDGPGDPSYTNAELQGLESLENGQVKFRYKDYARGGREASLTLSADEFLRRFAQHVLPPGFVRIRSFGFLASRRLGL